MEFRLGRYKISDVYLQILISGILLVTYAYIGVLAKFIVVPYVFYVIFKNDIRFFPALALQLLTENFTIYVILLACIVWSVVNSATIFKAGLKNVFIIYLLLLIYIIFHFLYRLFVVGGDWVDLISRYYIFLNIAPFFMGVIYKSKKNDLADWNLYVGLIIVLILSFIMKSRLVFYAVPFFFVFSLYNILNFKYINDYKYLLISVFSLGLLGLVFLNFTTFTLINTALYALLIFYANAKPLKRVLHFVTTIKPVVLILAFMGAAVLFEGDRNVNEDVLNKKITIDNFADRAVAKLIDDRVPFWKGGIKQVVKNQNYLMPVNLDLIEAENADGDVSEITFGAHTLYIEIFRVYGIITGFIVFAIYLYVVLKGSKLLLMKNRNKYLIALLAVSLSVSTLGAMGGTYPLGLGFGFLNVGILGISYGEYLSKKRKNVV